MMHRARVRNGPFRVDFGCHPILHVEFAAPEQVTGGAVTTATDVYSSGVLLFFLLGGRRRPGSPAETMRALVDAEYPRLAGVHRDLSTVVAKALKKDPAARYPSATSFAEDLRRYFNHEPIGARPDTLAYRTAKFFRRRWREVTVAAALVFLLAGLAAFHALRLATERNHARLEAAKAAHVSDLLIGMLTASDPYATHDGKEPTVRGLLDSGAERVQKELAGQPELEAQMLTTIGRVYWRLGALDKAQPLLEEAVTIGRRLRESEGLAQSLNELGVVRREKGNYPAAARMLEEALSMRRRLLGKEHQDVAVTLVDLARVYTDQGDKITLNNLSHPLRLQGKYDEAAALLREALGIARPAVGEDHPLTAALRINLGRIQLLQGQAAAAEPLVRRGLEVRLRAFRPDDWRTGSAKSLLGAVLTALGRREAKSLLLEAQRVLKDIPGPQGEDARATRQRLDALHEAMHRAGAAAAAGPLPHGPVRTPSAPSRP